MTHTNGHFQSLITQVRADIATRKAMPEYGSTPDAAIERIKTINETQRSFTLETVEALLLALDADNALIAKLQVANAGQDDHIIQQADKIDSLEKTNAGLGKRLCSLENRTLAVKLPKVSTERQNWTTWDWIQHLGGHYQNGNPEAYIEFGSVYAVEQMLKQFSRTVYVICQTEIVAALEKQLTAAGITLVVGQ